MSEHHFISDAPLTLNRLEHMLTHKLPLKLSEEAEGRIRRCRDYLDRKIAEGKESYYGINTGFGVLCDEKISKENLELLQYNLVTSHACGTGAPVEDETVRLMLLLKIQSLAYGRSGVRIEVVRRLIDFYNAEIYPVVYSFGSLGASGDLAPLAHLTLPLIGLGEIRYKGQHYSGAKASEILQASPLSLQVKEGLALLNGTQFMSAMGVRCLLKARHLLRAADAAAALSLEAFDGRLEPFHELIGQVRPHPGQVQCAARIRAWTAGSEIASKKKHHVQDPYSFRCVPQVHGASADMLRHAEEVFVREINSVTDNPLIFPEEDRIISGGNFHGQILAVAFDYLGIALAELGSISERRTFQLLSGSRGLPLSLTPEPGLHSGLMVAQYTAASVVSRNKQLCTPASADSVPSSNGQEDHVSMGANAGLKTLEIADNLQRILAVELMAAAQALDFRRPLRSSEPLEALHAAFREKVLFLQSDRPLYEDMASAEAFIETYPFLNSSES